MARRNVLHGASAWEREERANQQRDYAAQLQQQVQQKQAKQKRERALRQQEQREELDKFERERATATRQHQPQYEEVAPSDPPIPAHSPHRAVSLPHMPMTDQGAHLLSPLKAMTTDPSLSNVETNSWPIVAQSENHDPASMLAAATGGVPEFHAPSFATAPSIFESLVREPGIGARSIAFYDDLAALQRLSAEFESVAKSRWTKTQSNYAKPNFVHQQDTPLSTAFASSSPEKTRTDQCIQVKDDGNLIENEHAVPRLIRQHRLSLDGLLGESVLLPLNTKRQRHPSHDRSTTQALQSSVTPLQRFTTAAKTTNDVEDETTMKALDNHSEMLHFTPTVCRDD